MRIPANNVKSDALLKITCTEKSTAFLQNFTEKEGCTLEKNLALTPSPAKLSSKKLEALLFRYFRPVDFVANEGVKSDTLVHAENQSVREFILSLQTQASKCNHGPEMDDQLRDHLIAGMSKSKIRDQTFQLHSRVSLP